MTTPLRPTAAIFSRQRDAEAAVADLVALGIDRGAIRLETLPRPLFNALAPLGISAADATLLEGRLQGGDVLLRLDGTAPAGEVEALLERHGGLLVRSATA